MSLKIRLSEAIVTFFYVGKIKYAPGTFGSVAAFPLAYLILHLWSFGRPVFNFRDLSRSENELVSLFVVLIAVSLLLFIIGTYCSGIYAAYYRREDPKEVVIDEVVGQLLTLTLCYLGSAMVRNTQLSDYVNAEVLEFCFVILLPFLLFRFFDIFKPWPINWLDQNIKGGLGIMLDDIMAAFLASLIYYGLVFAIIDWMG